MSVGFVLGNGESRLGFDLGSLRGVGPIYGCNALYRDFIPDVLFAVDKKMVDEIFANGVSNKCVVIYRHTDNTGRRVLKSSNGGELDDQAGSASGPTALRVMCQYEVGVTDIYLIGFDIFGNNGLISNVYKGTSNYAPSDNRATMNVNWIRKMERVFEQFPSRRFFRVGDNLQVPPGWEKIPNYTTISFDVFKAKLRRVT